MHASVAADASVPGPARTDKPIISARDVVKRYGETIAVAGLDLTIWPGEIFGILGPNGAGKTTTLEMLEGLRPPDGGEIRVAGFDPVSEPKRVHRVIGVQLQSTALFDYLNCAEIIALFAALVNLYRVVIGAGSSGGRDRDECRGPADNQRRGAREEGPA